MPVTVSDLRETLPDFDAVDVDDEIAVNGTTYTVLDKETYSPGPGESTFTLSLSGDNGTHVLTWNEAHTVEVVWIHEQGADPMTDGTEVESIEYHG
ncbi:hypothetical protein [Halobaculum magnesiiphilum]|uniref:Uncharacterized protein n=1 Tax=Halobaculum magnesiiphilum TaxID=1017351 RepID=A0A8T8WFB9_9EURY|nr:hypothetical protein [Halobaculum magnesiiphilum]QZP38545.1 hypothetical protein K6T50_05230 [Halobaculum magnesiiphilum]